MKKTFLLSLCLMTLAVNAQTERHEVRISCGIGQDRHFNNIRNDMEDYTWLDVFTMPISWLKNFNASLNIEYFYNMDKHFAVGAIVGGFNNGKFTQTRQEQGMAGETLTTKEHYRELTGHALYFLPVAKWTWYRNRVISIYSKGGFGLRKYVLDVKSNYYPEQHENKWKTAFQLAPFGIEVGWKHFKFYEEYGFGHQGYITAGLAFLF